MLHTELKSISTIYCFYFSFNKPIYHKLHFWLASLYSKHQHETKASWF